MKRSLLFLVLFAASFLQAQWIQTNGPSSYYVRALAISNTNLFAGTDGGVFLSTDNGTNWNEANIGLSGTPVFTLIVSGTNIFGGTNGARVFLYTDNGAGWISTGNALNSSVTALAVNNTTLFAGTATGIVWRRPLSEMITSVETHSTVSPVYFSLSQNYPNPFNPSTIIKYSIPNEEFVSLKVFNSLGEEVAELLNETKPVGNYSVTFNASNLTSGVYFYKIAARNFVETKKMILLR